MDPLDPVPPHQDRQELGAFMRVRDGDSTDPGEIMRAIAVATSCANSGHCVTPDRHEAQLARFWNLLAGESDG